MAYLVLGIGILIGVLLIVSRNVFYSNFSEINLSLKKRLDLVLKIACIAPVIVLSIIIVLTLTYFKSKIYIRISHAWLVANFWIFSVIFYYIFLEMVKIKKSVKLLPLVGMFIAAGIAIYQTPLPHYESVFSGMNLIIPNIFGLLMLVTSYYINYGLLKKEIVDKKFA